ncbi:hypothetical protein EX30DRAFT_387754 [Ascodesmis nigricans]|uniref:Uncharacterized protein n=1 Tax=Ascodesmis nigricans TaxID=341454 RepID=A0A4V3SHS0_9PEZI|nr:hypothetical protein EX30DRAFT_387754 [Ascodesmis nigricans]
MPVILTHLLRSSVLLMMLAYSGTVLGAPTGRVSEQVHRLERRAPVNPNPGGTTFGTPSSDPRTKVQVGGLLHEPSESKTLTELFPSRIDQTALKEQNDTLDRYNQDLTTALALFTEKRLRSPDRKSYRSRLNYVPTAYKAIATALIAKGYVQSQYHVDALQKVQNDPKVNRFFYELIRVVRERKQELAGIVTEQGRADGTAAPTVAGDSDSISELLRKFTTAEELLTRERKVVAQMDPPPESDRTTVENLKVNAYYPKGRPTQGSGVSQ